MPIPIDIVANDSHREYGSIMLSGLEKWYTVLYL
jgi:hypothetical protein